MVKFGTFLYCRGTILRDMTVERIKNWSPPFGSSPDKIVEWIMRHYKDHLDESAERIHDFPDFTSVTDMDDLDNTSLADPGADRIVFWDDSDGQYEFLVPNTGISITANNLDVDHDAANNFVANEHIDWTGATNDFKTTGGLQSRGPFCDVRTYTDFATAVSTIGATEATLLIPTQQSVTDDVTVPATLHLFFTRGGSLNISNTKTVTINGPLSAGLFQIFEGAGAVAFGSNSAGVSYPQWWGAVVDGATDDTAAIEAADDAGRPVCLTKGNWGIADLTFAKPPIFMTACELTVLSSVSTFGVKFEKDCVYKGHVLGSVYLDMSGSGTDNVIGVIIDGRFWRFPKISVKGSGKANGQVGVSLQDHTTTALTHNQIDQLFVASCDIGFRVFLDDTGDNWAINNRLRGGYIQLCTYGMEFRDDDGTYGCRQNEWDCYIETCDYGVYLNGSGASKALMVCYNDLFKIKFDGITSNQWFLLEGNASGDLTPWMTFFSRSNLVDIFLQASGTYTYLHSSDFTQVDLSRIRQLQAWGDEVYSHAVTGGGTYTPDCNQARYQRFVVADNTAFTIGSPNNGKAGEIFTVDIYNNSGGAMGAITWGGTFKLAGAFTNPADTTHRLIQFIYDNTTPVWREVNRSAADQAN